MLFRSNEAGEENFDRVDLGRQQATARQQCRRVRETVADTAARRASDAIAHQHKCCNQSDNEAIAQRAANAEQHCVQRQAEEEEVRYQHWQLDAQRH